MASGPVAPSVLTFNSRTTAIAVFICGLQTPHESGLALVGAAVFHAGGTEVWPLDAGNGRNRHPIGPGQAADIGVGGAATKAIIGALVVLSVLGAGALLHKALFAGASLRIASMRAANEAARAGAVNAELIEARRARVVAIRILAGPFAFASDKRNCRSREDEKGEREADGNHGLECQGVQDGMKKLSAGMKKGTN